MRTLVPLLLVTAGLLGLAQPAFAVFHLWEIKEVFSNADGSVQYAELTTTSPNERSLTGHQIVATSDGNPVTFTFGSDLSGSTANRSLLIATPGFAALPGAVPPDYVLPCGPFFDPTAASITINFVGVDSWTFAGAVLPKDGTNSLVDQNPIGVPNLMVLPSSPANFAGQVGALALSGCLQAGTCEPCDDGQFCNGTESCSASACVAENVCQGECDEINDACLAPPVPAAPRWALGALALLAAGAALLSRAGLRLRPS